MNNILHNIRSYKEFPDLVKRMVIMGDAKYGYDKTEKFVQAMFDKHCPFKEGDIATITVSPIINRESTPGWWCYRHLLKEGSQGAIIDVDWYGGHFMFLFQLMERTWIDDDGDISENSLSDPPKLILSDIYFM